MSARSHVTEITISEREVVFLVAAADVATLALEVTLLRERVVESLTLRDARDRARVKLTMLADERTRFGRLTRSDARVDVALTDDEAGYLQAMLLRAVRDEIAEVSHGTLFYDRDGEENALTMVFERSR